MCNVKSKIGIDLIFILTHFPFFCKKILVIVRTNFVKDSWSVHFLKTLPKANKTNTTFFSHD